MKRSEMIIHIIADLNRLKDSHIYTSPKSTITMEDIAEHILSTVEERGMKPPEHPTKVEQDLNYNPITVYEWESE